MKAIQAPVIAFIVDTHNGKFPPVRSFPLIRGRRNRDRMVVGFTTICAISVYHH